MRSTINLIRKTYRMAGPRERSIVLNNFAVLSALQGLTYLLPVLILPYLFRTLGPEKFGLIAFAQAFVQYFVILTDYGFNISATREISLCQNEPSRLADIYAAVMAVKTALVLASLAILAAVIFGVPKFRSDWPVYAISFGTAAGSALFPVWFFQGTEKMKYIAQLNILGGLAIAVLIFSAVRRSEDYLLIPVINSSVSLLTGILGQILVYVKLRLPLRIPEAGQVRHQLRAGWDVFISVVAVNAYTTTRVFAIGLLTTNTLTGFYSIAEKIAGMCQAFPLVSFSQALFPRLSKIFSRSKTRALRFMEKIQQITTRFSLICHPLLILSAPVIVRLVCGGDYPETVLTLRLLIVSVFFINSNAFRVQFLLVCGRSDLYARIHLALAAMGLPLIFCLIAPFSYIGAAMATVAIEAGVWTATFLMLRKLGYA